MVCEFGQGQQKPDLVTWCWSRKLHHDANMKVSQPVPLYVSFPLASKTALIDYSLGKNWICQGLKGLETLGEVSAQRPECRVLCVWLFASLTEEKVDDSNLTIETEVSGRDCSSLRKRAFQGSVALAWTEDLMRKADMQCPFIPATELFRRSCLHLPEEV